MKPPWSKYSIATSGKKIHEETSPALVHTINRMIGGYTIYEALIRFQGGILAGCLRFDQQKVLMSFPKMTPTMIPKAGYARSLA